MRLLSSAFRRAGVLIILLSVASFARWRSVVVEQKDRYWNRNRLSKPGDHDDILLRGQRCGSDERKKALPMLNETGGLVVFLHIAKTGGTTVRDSFTGNSFPNVHVHRVKNETELLQDAETIERFLSARQNTENNTMLLEIHGMHGFPMPVFQLHPYLHQWKLKAAANHKNVFVFTLLREPSAFYVSWFKFFKHPKCTKAWCDPPLMKPTEENLVRSLTPNHQCMYLARQDDKIVNTEFPVTASECKSVYELLRADADWVGTMETMQEVTLPLLSFILSASTEKGRSFTVKNKAVIKDEILSLGSLSEFALQKTRDASVFDQYLYESATEDYRLDMWENFVVQ